MNNKLIAWGVIAVLVLGGVWYYTLSSMGGGASSSPTATSTVSVATTTETAAPAPIVKKKAPAPVTVPAKVSGYNSISYLISLKEPLVCTVKATSPVSREGTLYVAAGMLRGNFSYYSNGMLVKSSMIDDGTYLYSWKNGATNGLMLLASLSASGSATAMNGGIDPATSFSYLCAPWTADVSVFTPPASVSFSNTL